MVLAFQNKVFKTIMQTVPLWILAYLFENVYLGDFAALFATILLAKLFVNFIGNQARMIEFLKLGALFLIFSQNLSWLIASMIHHIYLDHSIAYTISKLMGGGLLLSNYFLSIIYVTLFCAFIVLFSGLKKIKFLEKQLLIKILGYQSITLKKINRLIIVLTIINILLIVFGYVGQRAILVDPSNTVTPLWVVLYVALIPAQTLLISLCIFKAKIYKGSFFRKFAIPIFASLPTLYVYFSFGRRMIIFAIFSFVYWFFFFSKSKPNFWKSLVIIAIVYPILSQVLIFNNFLRGGNGIEDWNLKSSIELIPLAWEKYTSSDKLIEAEEESSLVNLSERPLVATPLGLCIQYPKEFNTFTYGENLYNSLMWTIPGGLINKTEYPIQEALLYDHFKIGRDLQEDAADSIYLVAYTEFGWVGLLLYGLLVYFIWFIVLFLINKNKLDLFFVFVSASICFELMIMTSGEGALNAWFVSLRSILFFILLGGFLKFLNIKILSNN